MKIPSNFILHCLRKQVHLAKSAQQGDLVSQDLSKYFKEVSPVIVIAAMLLIVLG